MHKEESRINIGHYLRNITVRPIDNIKGNTYVHWGWCVVLLLIFISIGAFSGFFIHFLGIVQADSDDASLWSLAGMMVYLLIMRATGYFLPLLLINGVMIYTVNVKQSAAPSTLRKVFSDYTGVMIQSLVIFFTGALTLTTENALLSNGIFRLVGMSLVTLALTWWVTGSLIMLRFYMSEIETHMLKILIIYFVLLISVTGLYSVLLMGVI